MPSRPTYRLKLSITGGQVRLVPAPAQVGPLAAALQAVGYPARVVEADPPYVALVRLADGLLWELPEGETPEDA